MADLSDRAKRFGRHLRGEYVPGFADLADPPGWTRLDDDERSELAALMALLVARPAIDAELGGARLGELAAAVGEDRFDRVCDAEMDGICLSVLPVALPRAEDLERRGSELLDAARQRPDLARVAVMADAIRTACLVPRERVEIAS